MTSNYTGNYSQTKSTDASDHTALPKPKVQIARMALEKIQYLVRKDRQEISGLGITRVVGDTIFVDDVKMLDQVRGPAHTDIDAEAAAKLMFEWREREGNLNFWWHSHVNMGVFWSSQDLATIRDMGKQGMCIASVFNKKGEIRTAVACNMKTPFAETEQLIMYDNLPLTTESIVDSETQKLWDAELASCVKFQPPARHPAVSHGQRTGGTHLTGISADFVPVKTDMREYWNTPEQGRLMDIDWQCRSAQRDPKLDRYTKSDAQMKAEADWCSGKTIYEIRTELGDEWAEFMIKQRSVERDMLDISDDVPPQKPSSLFGWRSMLRQLKLDAATWRPEIQEYDEELNMFKLYTNGKITADYYLSDEARDFRASTLRAYWELKKHTPTQEEIEDVRDFEQWLIEDLRDIDALKTAEDFNNQEDEAGDDQSWRGGSLLT